VSRLFYNSCFVSYWGVSSCYWTISTVVIQYPSSCSPLHFFQLNNVSNKIGSQTADAYSNWGLTIVKYADSLSCFEHLLKLRFRKLSRCFSCFCDGIRYMWKTTHYRSLTVLYCCKKILSPIYLANKNPPSQNKSIHNTLQWINSPSQCIKG